MKKFNISKELHSIFGTGRELTKIEDIDFEPITESLIELLKEISKLGNSRKVILKIYNHNENKFKFDCNMNDMQVDNRSMSLYTKVKLYLPQTKEIDIESRILSEAESDYLRNVVASYYKYLSEYTDLDISIPYNNIDITISL